VVLVRQCVVEAEKECLNVVVGEEGHVYNCLSFQIRNWSRWCSFCSGRPIQKSPGLRRFKSDRDESLQECSSSDCTSIGGVRILMWSHTLNL